MHKTEIRVHWFDVDKAGVVYFGNYFRFFSIAEDECMRALGLSHKELIERYGIAFTRTETSCQFIRPARYDDLIEVCTWPKLEKDRFITFQFKLFRKEDQILLAEGMIRSGCVRFENELKLIRIPEGVLIRLEGKL